MVFQRLLGAGPSSNASVFARVTRWCREGKNDAKRSSFLQRDITSHTILSSGSGTASFENAPSRSSAVNVYSFRILLEERTTYDREDDVRPTRIEVWKAIDRDDFRALLVRNNVNLYVNDGSSLPVMACFDDVKTCQDVPEDTSGIPRFKAFRIPDVSMWGFSK